MEYIVVECYCTCILREFKIFFQPATFDNFKHEKISDFKTVSVSQSKNQMGYNGASTSKAGSAGTGHTFSSEVFRSFVFSAILFCQNSCISNCFVKSQCWLLDFCHLTSFFSIMNLSAGLFNFKSRFSPRNRANPGKFSMDSNSLIKDLNKLPRT